jgi:hypothetical protein
MLTNSQLHCMKVFGHRFRSQPLPARRYGNRNEIQRIFLVQCAIVLSVHLAWLNVPTFVSSNKLLSYRSHDPPSL